MKQLDAPRPDRIGRGEEVHPEGGRHAQESIADIRTTRRAIRSRWPIREEMRQPIIDSLTTIATNPGFCGVRESVQAARALLDADKINMEDEARAIKKPELIDTRTGQVRVSFEAMTDEDLDRFIEAGGQL